MAKVNLKTIKSLNPCQERLDNYVDHYGNRSLTPRQFLRLKKISHRDKLWVAFRLMPKANSRFAAGEIAKSVLPLFEAKYPHDNRPRLAIEQALAKRFNKDAAYAATTARAAYAAATAADAATTARAAYAAATAAYAAYIAATAAATAARAAYAVSAADVAAPNGAAQERLQLKIILKYWK